MNEGFIELKKEELEKIQALLPGSQRSIQIGFHAKVRSEKKRYVDAICTLSSHFIGIFVPSETKEDFEYHNITHISLVDSILFKDKSVIIQMGQKNLWIESKHKYEFAQLLYRNYYLSFLFLGTEEEIEFFFNENDDEKKKYFPPLDSLPVSPSQQFQFNYFANCTEEEKARYYHAAVRYVHSMITTKNTIFDISMLPENLFKGKNAKENLRQIFAVLSVMKIISGICLSNYDCPDIISTFSSLIPNLRSLRIVHFSNCGATEGLDELAEAIINANNLNVSYWDLSYNKFKNFKPFAKIITNSKKAIKCINLNYCNISHEGSTSFFNALSSFKHVDKLKYLSIAKMSLSDDDSIIAFRNFLKVSNLFYIDVSSMEEEISAVLKALTDEEQPNLRSLILNKLSLDYGAVFLINKIIKNSKSLKEISLSGSKITPDDLASIILTINKNKNIKSFSLNLDEMDLEDIDKVLDAFSNKNSKKSKKESKSEDENNDDYVSKWTKLSFASNSLNEADLKNLISSISKFHKLEEINLDNNFNNSMKGIDEELCRLLDFENLISISIAGSKSNRLKDKLAPLLDKIAESGKIERLDIRNNDFNDVSCLRNVIKKCKNLSVFRYDGNKFSNLEDTILAKNQKMSKIKKLTEFNFPINDCRRLVKSIEQPDDNFIDEIENYMREVMAIVKKNREMQDLYCELPFKAPSDVEKLIHDLSTKTHQNLEKFNEEEVTQHSYITKVFGLPFPCQKLLMLLRNDREKSSLFLNSQRFFKKVNTKPYGKKEPVDVSKKLKKSEYYYAEDSMNNVLEEYDSGLYPEFFTNSIFGYQFKEFFDNLLQIQDKEIENKSTEQNKSKRFSNSGKITKRKLGKSDSENDQSYDESSSEANKNLNKTQRYLIRGKDNQAEDEKTRIQFRNANIREVDDISLNLETRCIDNEKLDELMSSSFNQTKETKSSRSKDDGNISKNGRAKEDDKQSMKNSRAYTKSEKVAKVENNDYNKNSPTSQRKVKSNETDYDDSDKDKSIIMKKKRILSNQDDANSSSDDEHIEKLRRQNLKGSGKRKSNQPSQQIPQQQQRPQPQPQQQIQRRNRKNKEEESDDDDQKQNKVLNRKKINIHPSESSSDDNDFFKNQKVQRMNSSDSENDDENGNSQINKGRKSNRNRPSKYQQLSNSSDNENDEVNKRSRKRSSNSQRSQQQLEQEEERKRQQEERRRQQEEERRRQQEEERRRQQEEERKRQQEEERRRQQEEERRRQQEEEQERLRQQERRRQQLEQEEEKRQQKMAKKQTPPPRSKKDQTLKGLLNSSSEEISANEEEKNRMPPKRSAQNQRQIQKPPNQPDPGLAMDYAHKLLAENERKPRPSKIPLHRKTTQ